jgi:transcriptional regulator with XRE-family HTH domain
MNPNRIAKIQSDMNYTIFQMAEALGVPSRTYQNWLYGVAKPNFMQIAVLENWEQLIEQGRKSELIGKLTGLTTVAFLGWIMYEVGKEAGQRENPIKPRKRRRKDAD